MRTLMKFAVAACGLLMAVTITLAADISGASGSYYGLFVGVDEYLPVMQCLDIYGCKLDANRMRKCCFANGKWTESGVQTLLDSAASKNAIRAAITNLIEKAVAGDVVLIYQSSHGRSYGNKDTCLCTYDADYTDSELASDLSQFKSGVKLVVIVDACYSGGLFKSATKAQTWNLAASVVEKMKALPQTKDADAKINPDEIGWIASCDYDQVSYADWSGSAFTKKMLSGWEYGEADADKDESVTFYELYDYAKNGKQIKGQGDAPTAQCAGEETLKGVIAGDVPAFKFEIEDGVLTGYSGAIPAALEIPEGVVEIAEDAFSGCERLESVALPSTLKVIGDYAFECCSGLKTVTGGANLERVGYDVFDETRFLYGDEYFDGFPSDAAEEAWWDDQETHIHYKTVGGFIVDSYGYLDQAWNEEYYEYNEWSGNEKWNWEYRLALPEGIRGIAAGAFRDLPITSVSLPNSLRYIGESAFACTYLKSLDLGKGVESIGAYAFEDAGYEDECNPESGIRTLSLPASVRYIGDGAFSYFGRVHAISGLTSLIEFGDEPFCGCETVDFDIEGGILYGYEWVDLVYMGSGWSEPVVVGAFEADGMTVRIPEGVVEIAEGALSDLDEAFAIRLPSTLKVIGDSAFEYCINLKSITGGENLERVGRDVLEETRMLYGDMYFFGFPSESTEEAWWNSYERDLHYVTACGFVMDSYGSLERAWDDVYYDERTDTWTWKYALSLPEGIRGIAAGAFAELPITSVALPDSLRYIGDSAFESCCYMTSLSFGNGLAVIGDYAFACAGCCWDEVSPGTPIESLTFPSSLYWIGDCAFEDFGNLRRVYGLSSGVRLGYDVFWGTPYEWGWDVARLLIENGVVVGVDWDCVTASTYDAVMADGASRIAEDGSLTIPEGVTNIAECALCDLEELRSVSLPSTLRSIEDCAFECCWNLKTVTGGANLERIGSDAFCETRFLCGDEYMDGFPSEEAEMAYYNGLELVYLSGIVVGVRGWLEEAWNEKYYVVDPVTKEETWTWSYELVLPEGTRGVAGTFLSCLPITSLSVPGSMKRIEPYTFGGDGMYLRSLVLNEGIDEICEEAFYCQYELPSVDLPASVRKVGKEAFGSCDALQKVTFRSHETVFDSSAFVIWVAGGTVNKWGYPNYVPVANTNLLPIVYNEPGYVLTGWQVSVDESLNEYAEDPKAIDVSRVGLYPTTDMSVFDVSYVDDSHWLWSYRVAPVVTTVYAIAFDANGGSETMAPLTGCRQDTAYGLPICAFERTGYDFVGWALTPDAKDAAYADGVSVSALTAVPGGAVTLYAVWKRATLWDLDINTPVAVEDAFDASAARTYDGFVRDAEGRIVGTLSVKTAKAKAGAETTTATVTIQIAGAKKETVKGDVSLATGRMTATDKSGHELEMLFTADAMVATYGSYSVDGAVNKFVSKDSEDKAAAEAAMNAWKGAYAVAFVDENGWAGLSVSIAVKGKTKVSGMLADGTRVSASAQMLIGAEGVCCIPVFCNAKTAQVGFVLWLSADGLEVDGLDEAVVGRAGPLKDYAAFCLDTAALESKLDDGVTELLPDFLPDGAEIKGGDKWVVMPDEKGKAAKSGKLTWDKAAGEVNEEKSSIDGFNVSSLKLTYTAKTGVFKGSFKVYTVVKGALKNTTVSVNGIVIDGIGYGAAVVKKVGGVAVTIE